MLELLNDPSVVAAADFVSEAAKSSLSEKLFIIAILWRTMGGKIANLKAELSAGVNATMAQFHEHFSKIENGLGSVADEVSSLKATVAKDLQAQAQRLGNVENRIDNLNVQVVDLKNKIGG